MGNSKGTVIRYYLETTDAAKFTYTYADVADVILSEFPEFKYDFESLKKYIRCKIRQRMVRPDICDNYKY